MGKIIERWLDNHWPIYPQATIDDMRFLLDKAAHDYAQIEATYHKVGDMLAEKTLELESLKKKIVEKAKVQPILKAKTAAEIRRMVEQENEREFEEQANGF